MNVQKTRPICMQKCTHIWENTDAHEKLSGENNSQNGILDMQIHMCTHISICTQVCILTRMFYICEKKIIFRILQNCQQWLLLLRDWEGDFWTLIPF